MGDYGQRSRQRTQVDDLKFDCPCAARCLLIMSEEREALRANIFLSGVSKFYML